MGNLEIKRDLNDIKPITMCGLYLDSHSINRPFKTYDIYERQLEIQTLTGHLIILGNNF